jgi:hypothetical protein
LTAQTGSSPAFSKQDSQYLRRAVCFRLTAGAQLSRPPHYQAGLKLLAWGGFFDHVPPPRALAPNNTDTDLVDGKALLGCRCPCIVASPWTVGTPSDPTVNHAVFDHTSVATRLLFFSARIGTRQQAVKNHAHERRRIESARGKKRKTNPVELAGASGVVP